MSLATRHTSPSLLARLVSEEWSERRDDGHESGINAVLDRRHAEFKELAGAIALDVHSEIIRAGPRAITLSPARRDFTHLQARAHRGELGLDVISIHTF